MKPRIKISKAEIERIGEWKIWALEPPTVPGFYWFAGFFTDNQSRREMNGPQTEPYEPFAAEFSQEDLKHYRSRRAVIQFAGYAPENFIWFGPLTPPAFKSRSTVR
jgi:hypothetical protein